MIDGAECLNMSLSATVLEEVCDGRAVGRAHTALLTSRGRRTLKSPVSCDMSGFESMQMTV